MRRVCTLILSILILIFFSVEVSFPSSSLQEAKDFELKDIKGNKYKLSDLKGKVILLNFWATWCKICLKENPSLNRLYNKFRNKDFIVIGISIDRSIHRVEDYLKENPLSFPILMDSKGDVFVKTYTLRGVPATIVINREGAVVERVIGGQDFDSARYTELIDRLLKNGQQGI